MHTEREQAGRRETNKRATRVAIQAAADRLIADRGFEAATVREIAQAANVTERTFYRYFDGKEDLAVTQATAWVNRLHDAIVARPAHEPPLQAVERAMVEIARQIDESSRSQLVWFFTNQTGAVEMLRRADIKPLLRVEQMVASALLARTATTDAESVQHAQANAELAARVSIAVFRTVAGQRRRALAQRTETPPAGELITRAFEQLTEMATAGDTGRQSRIDKTRSRP